MADDYSAAAAAAAAGAMERAPAGHVGVVKSQAPLETAPGYDASGQLRTDTRGGDMMIPPESASFLAAFDAHFKADGTPKHALMISVNRKETLLAAKYLVAIAKLELVADGDNEKEADAAAATLYAMEKDFNTTSRIMIAWRMAADEVRMMTAKKHVERRYRALGNTNFKI